MQNGGLSLVQRDHPCIAMPCVCVLTTVVAVFLGMILSPFTASGYGIATFVMLMMAGPWFIMLSAIWYNRSRGNLIWSGIAVTIGWLLTCTAVFALFPAGAVLGGVLALAGGTVATILIFIFGYVFLEVDQDGMIPIPYFSRNKEDSEIIQYPYTYQPVQTTPKLQDYGSDSKPRHWGSWKGQVIRAIAEARTPLTLDEIISSTDLQPNAVATAILELLEIGVLIYENDETHSVEPSIYHEYRAYIEKTQKPFVEDSEPLHVVRPTDGRKHRTNNGEMVRSKSEVIVANTLASLGLFYEYEKPLANPQDSSDMIRPDFTINHGGRIFYWEHLGMLHKPQYRASWEWKMNWYHKCGYEVITSRDGEDESIDSPTIEAIARKRILESR